MQRRERTLRRILEGYGVKLHGSTIKNSHLFIELESANGTRRKFLFSLKNDRYEEPQIKRWAKENEKPS